MKKILKLSVACLAGLAFTTASAHMVSIGFENAGAGAVTFWGGNYSHSGTPGNVPTEGSMNLQGINGTVFNQTLAFDMNTLAQPAGLIDGTTNFYITGGVNQPGNPLSNDDSDFLSQCPACGPVTAWQGVTFAGLVAGDYQFTYVPIANPTQDWTPWNDSLSSTLTLSGVIINPNPVPEPATLALFGTGLAFLGFRMRKRNVS